MIYNIRDKRERPFRWKNIDAIIEATSQDNSCKDSDEIASSDLDVTYEQKKGVSLEAAIKWAAQQRSPVTLYLYDAGAVGD